MGGVGSVGVVIGPPVFGDHARFEQRVEAPRVEQFLAESASDSGAYVVGWRVGVGGLNKRRRQTPRWPAATTRPDPRHRHAGRLGVLTMMVAVRVEVIGRLPGETSCLNLVWSRISTNSSNSKQRRCSLGAAGSVLLRFSQSGGTDARSFHLAA